MWRVAEVAGTAQVAGETAHQEETSLSVPLYGLRDSHKEKERVSEQFIPVGLILDAWHSLFLSIYLPKVAVHFALIGKWDMAKIL